MPTNGELAAVFEEIADLREIEGDNWFRVNAYRNAAQTIRGMGPAVAAMADEELAELDGIGDAIRKKIAEIVATGRCQTLDEARARTGAGLIDVLRLPGLGPKRVRELRDGLGVRCLTDLEAACEQGLVKTLPGFGERTEQRVLESIRKRRSAGPVGGSAGKPADA